MTAEMRATMRDLREAVRRDAKEKQEELAPKERYRLREDVIITISGLSGTGKTTVGKMLALLYSVPFEKIGERQRKKIQKETGQQVIGSAERTTEEDMDLDEITRKHVKKGGAIIIEGRLAGIVAKAERNNIIAQGGEAPTIFAIIFKAKDKKRFPRIHDRLIGEKPTLADDALFTVEFVAAQTLGREEEDRKHWRESHPEFGRANPFNNKTIRHFEKVYDKVADANNKVIDTALLIHFALVEQGLAIRETMIHPLSLPTQGIIFEA